MIVFMVIVVCAQSLVTPLTARVRVWCACQTHAKSLNAICVCVHIGAIGFHFNVLEELDYYN